MWWLLGAALAAEEPRPDFAMVGLVSGITGPICGLSLGMALVDGGGSGRIALGAAMGTGGWVLWDGAPWNSLAISLITSLKKPINYVFLESN